MMKSRDFLLTQLTAIAEANRIAESAQEQPEKTGNHVLHDPRCQRDFLREIAERRAQGESLRSIANRLNRQGLRGPRGGRWYECSVRNAIKKFGMADTQVAIEHGHDRTDASLKFSLSQKDFQKEVNHVVPAIEP